MNEEKFNKLLKKIANEPNKVENLHNSFLHIVSLSEFIEKKHEEAKNKYEEHEQKSDYEAQYWWGRLIAFGELKKYIKQH